MKLTKSKQALADAIHASGKGWLCGNFAAQQDDGEIWFSNSKPKWSKGHGTFDMGYEDHITVGTLVANRHQTVLSREEYFSAYPAETVADADGWIEWNGGECPVGNGVLVDVKYRDGRIKMRMAALVPVSCLHGVTGPYWRNDGIKGDIIAYRLHKPGVKPTAVGDDETNLADKEELEALEGARSPEVRAKLADIYLPSIEWLAADYRNKLGYANRKQKEADDAKAAADAALGELERAGESLGLVIGVAKPEPELVITDWRYLREGDAIWFGGDDEQAAGEYSVLEVEHADYGGNRAIRIDTISTDYWIDVTDDWKFIRRP